MPIIGHRALGVLATQTPEAVAPELLHMSHLLDQLTVLTATPCLLTPDATDCNSPAVHAATPLLFMLSSDN